MHAVDAVRAEIGQEAAGVVPEPAKCAEEAVLVERHPWGGAEVEIPIEPVRRVAVRGGADAVGVHVRVVPEADEMDLAEFTALDDLRRFRVVG